MNMLQLEKIVFGNGQGHYLKVLSFGLDEKKSYEIHFNSESIEFYCHSCEANRSYVCNCSDYEWGQGFIMNDTIMTSNKLDVIMRKYELMKENIKILQFMSRDELCTWLSKKIKENEEIEYDCNF
jgi:hypothetical protein